MHCLTKWIDGLMSNLNIDWWQITKLLSGEMIEPKTISEGIDHDDFLFRLIEAGHSAIFQWVAVYLASGIGLIQIIVELLNPSKTFFFDKTVFAFIYLILIGLMTYSFMSILNIVHLQNKWINEFHNKEQKETFYKSRGYILTSIADRRENLSAFEWGLILGHFALFFVFGLLIWFSGLGFLGIRIWIGHRWKSECRIYLLIWKSICTISAQITLNFSWIC